MSEANIIADAVHRMEQELEQAKKQLAVITADRDEWKHTAGVYQYDNDNLKKVINRSNAKAEHYMKQNAGLTTGLEGLAQGLLNLIKNAQVHAFGDRDNRGSPQRRAQPAEIDQMPRVVRAGPRAAVN
jgi:hydroxymethylpyrimidine pyrophosphatase-like HAD family hydrolase